MGAETAAALADEVSNGFDMREALSMHLTFNHYPPVPASMTDVAVRAIELAADDEWYEYVDLPDGVTYRGQTYAPASEIISNFHLEYFVDCYDDWS